MNDNRGNDTGRGVVRGGSTVTGRGFAAGVAQVVARWRTTGLRVLRIVDPPVGLDRPEARGLAYGAWDVLDSAIVCGTLLEAVAGSGLVAGTTGRAHPAAWTPRASLPRRPTRRAPR